MAGLDLWECALGFMDSQVLLTAEELAEVGTIVDVGGASGAFLTALAERFPDLRGTVLDLPAVGPIAEHFIRQAGLCDRLSFHAANFWADQIPAGAGAYSLGFILHDWSKERGSQILGKIARSAGDGALLVLGEYMLNDEKTGPLHVARQNLNMLLTAQGRERSLGEYREWVGEFGFEMENVYLTTGGKYFLIARKRPVKERAGREEKAARAQPGGAD